MLRIVKKHGRKKNGARVTSVYQANPGGADHTEKIGVCFYGFPMARSCIPVIF